MANKEHPQGFSIVVCCYNSASRIVPTVQHIAALHIPQNWMVEVIVVDNNCTDNSIEIISSYWEQHKEVLKNKPLLVVREEKAGQTFARKKGIATARYSHLLFCDDDNWLQEDYLEELAGILAMDSQLAAVGGMGTAVSSVDLPEFLQWIPISYACGPQQKETGYRTGKLPWLYGAGICINRHLLHKAIQIFPHDFTAGRVGKQLMGADDNELCYKLVLCGGKLYYSEKLRFSHFLEPRRFEPEYVANLLAGSAKANALLSPYGMAASDEMVTVFERRTSFRGTARILRFRMEAYKLFRNRDTFTSKELFTRYFENWYGYNMNKTVVENRQQILSNFHDIAERLFRFKGAGQTLENS